MDNQIPTKQSAIQDSDRQKKARSGAPVKKPSRGPLAKTEAFFQRVKRRYKAIIAICVSLLLAIGWIADRTYFRESVSAVPTINVFAGPPESMKPSIQTLFQNPKYKSLIIVPGTPVTYRFNSPNREFAYSFSVPILDGEPAMLIKIADEPAERVFRLNPKSFSPFTVHIQTRGFQFLLAVEGITPQGVRVRTFGP